MGLSYLEPLASPFDVADILLKEHPARFVLVDFHAEAIIWMAVSAQLLGRIPMSKLLTLRSCLAVPAILRTWA